MQIRSTSVEVSYAIMKPEMLSLGKAADICAVTRWTLWSYVNTGELKAIRTPGGHYRVAKNDLEEFILKRRMLAEKKKSAAVKKILVVDDDPKIRKFLKRVLGANGNDVMEAADGFEAGQKSIKFKPDILIVDIFMPRLDGFDVCRLMKKDPETRKTKIVAISGYDTAENRKEILSAGADLFIAKPLSKKVILDAVDQLSDRTEFAFSIKQ